MNKETIDDKYILSSVQNSLKILDTLSRKREATVAELSKQLGFSKASVFRMLYTLKSCYYVEKTPDAKYRLSMKFARYGSLVTGWQDFLETCIPYMQALRDKHNETVNLSIFTADNKVMFIHNEVSNYALQMKASIINENEPYCMASGKMLLAEMPSEKIEEYISATKFVPLTEHSIVSAEELRRRLAIIHENGYSEDAEESEIGLTCYAAPIFDHTGQCIAAISVSGMTSRILAKRETLIQSTMEIAKEISVALGSP